MATDLLTILVLTLAAMMMIFALRHALSRLAGVNLPRWITPAVIAATIIGASVWTEYSWFGRVTGQLPDSVAVLDQGQQTTALRPWTYLMPITARFVALDRAALIRSAARPGLVRGDLILIERWRPTQRVTAVWDCPARRRADLFGTAQVSPDGTLTGTDWLDLPADDPSLIAACTGPA
ncbi:hypothetical protein ACEYYB_03675 [Paracoccus sp. p4-l81]|uniref:hypothetical protein n=1 Tax=unclassified Paracoccus (in: a-proteobacteria) TaxID=2688777 RepID=UPI0035B6D7B5